MFTLFVSMSVLSTFTLLKHIRLFDAYFLDVYVIRINKVNSQGADMYLRRLNVERTACA